MALSLDDVAIADNQIEIASTQQDYVYAPTAMGGSVRMCDNRFAETWMRAGYSGLSVGLMNTTTDNQATHCLRAASLLPNMLMFKDNLARADDLPLVLPVLGAGDLPRGARVRVRLGAIDPIALDVSGTVIERLDAAPATGASEEDDSEDEAVAGPIAIAVDVNDTEATTGAAEPAPAPTLP